MITPMTTPMTRQSSGASLQSLTAAPPISTSRFSSSKQCRNLADPERERSAAMLSDMTVAISCPERPGRRWDDTRRVRDLLRSELNRGGYVGGRLPTEDQLIAEFGVSRAAVRDALAALRSEGLIERLQGIGTMVKRSKTIMRLAENHGVVEPSP